MLLYGPDDRPIAWRGGENKIGAPVPEADMVKMVRAAMRAGALNAIPAPRG